MQIFMLSSTSAQFLEYMDLRTRTTTWSWNKGIATQRAV